MNTLNVVPFAFIFCAFLMSVSLVFDFYGTLKNPDQRRGLFQIKRRHAFAMAIITLWIVSMGLVAYAVKMLVENQILIDYYRGNFP